MKRQILASLSILLLSGATATSIKPALAAEQIQPTPAITIAQNQPVAIKSGTFVAAEKPTTGTARIISENGQRYLVLDSAFSTSDQGPDLHVLLDPASQPPKTYQNLSRYVNLGKLQKYSGEQRYPIPAGINLSNFKSVVIWCRMANATFGYASLATSSTARK